MSKAKTKKRPDVEYVAGANEKREKLMGYLMAMPAIVLLIAFTVYPLCYLAYRSFFGGSIISKNPKFVGFENYVALVESADFHQVLVNTAIYTVITVGLTMVLAIVIAVWLNGKRNSKMNGITQTLIFTPHIISMVSVSTLFLWLMDSKNGFINAVLVALGFEPYSFLASPETALLSVALVSVWKGLGYYVLLIMAALQNIPTSVYEAAEMDDTPPLRTFFKITLPMISPTILFTSVVAVIAPQTHWFTTSMTLLTAMVNLVRLVLPVWYCCCLYVLLHISSSLLVRNVFTISKEASLCIHRIKHWKNSKPVWTHLVNLSLSL